MSPPSPDSASTSISTAVGTNLDQQTQPTLIEPTPFVTTVPIHPGPSTLEDPKGLSTSGGVEKSLTPESDSYDEKKLPLSLTNGDAGQKEAQTDVEGLTRVKSTKQELEAQGYLTGWKLAACFTSLLLAIFLVSLDQTILSPALPVIASKFLALDNVGWIASAFFLTQAPFILFYGQLSKIARIKNVFMTAITLFEIGSLICAVAPSVNVLIFGRAFAGLGAAGLFVCVITIISQIIPLERRAPFMGAFAAVWGASSVIGPLLGGVFTDHVSWRWCFYINLPIGGLAVVTIFFLLAPKPSPSELNPEDNRTMLRKYIELDWIGVGLVLGVVTCLILALSWGGNQKAWNSAAVITCFAVFGAFLPVLLYWCYRKGDDAILPLALLRNRTLAGATLQGFFIMLCLLAFMYYLPLEYQAVKGDSATKSGLAILPFMMLVVAGGLIGGGATGITGHYWSWMVFPPLLISTVGGGLFYTVTATTSNAKLSGFQALVGFGVGCAMQQGQIAVQAEFARTPTLIPQATAICSMLQLVGGVIGIAIAQVIFQNSLKRYLQPFGLDADTVTAIRSSVLVLKTLSADVKDQAIAAYVMSLRDVYIIAVPACILGSLSAAFVRSYNVKKMGLEIGAGA